MQRIFGILLTGLFFCAAGCFGIYLGHIYLAAEGRLTAASADGTHAPPATDAAPVRAAVPPPLLPAPSSDAVTDPRLQPASHQVAAALSTVVAADTNTLQFTAVNGKAAPEDGPMVIAVPAGKFQDNQTKLTVRLAGVDSDKKLQIKRKDDNGGQVLAEVEMHSDAEEISLKPIAVPANPDTPLILQATQEEMGASELTIHLVRPLVGGTWKSGNEDGDFAAEIEAPGPTLDLQLTGPVGATVQVTKRPDAKPAPEPSKFPLRKASPARWSR